MFSGCSSLKSLPDISNWNTNNVINLNGMFESCIKLENLPDISKWNIDNVEDIDNFISNCSPSIQLPENFKNLKCNDNMDKKNN